MARLTRSYVHGGSETPLIGQTIGEYFDAIAARFPDCDAVIARQQNVRWTYRQFKDQVDTVAAGLLALGLEPGDRVGIWSPNNAEWAVTQFATAKAGLVLVNINPAYRLAEVEYALNKVGCKALITATQLKTSDYIAMLRELAPELDRANPGQLKAAKLPELRAVIRIPAQAGTGPSRGMYGFDELPGLADDSHRAELGRLAGRLQFDDPINIQFTSGTTGFPKGATLTHHNILNNGFFIGET